MAARVAQAKLRGSNAQSRRLEETQDGLMKRLKVGGGGSETSRVAPCFPAQIVMAEV